MSRQKENQVLSQVPKAIGGDMATRGRTYAQRDEGAHARRLRQKAAERAAKKAAVTPEAVAAALELLAPAKVDPYKRLLSKIEESWKHQANAATHYPQDAPEGQRR